MWQKHNSRGEVTERECTERKTRREGRKNLEPEELVKETECKNVTKNKKSLIGE